MFLGIPGIVLLQGIILAVACGVLAVAVLVRRAEAFRDSGVQASWWHRWLVRANEAVQHRIFSNER